jgi:hypothetical protein
MTVPLYRMVPGKEKSVTDRGLRIRIHDHVRLKSHHRLPTVRQGADRSSQRRMAQEHA